jgi:hypothetical protein
VIGDNDRDRVIRFANLAGLVSDAVGVFCFRPVAEDHPTRYRAEQIPPHIEIGRVLFRACQDLGAIKGSIPVEPPTPSPASIAEGTPLEEGSRRGG